MSIIEIVTCKDFTSVGVRLVIYADKTRGGRVDLYELDHPTETIYEGYYVYQENAIARYDAIKNNNDAINWAYRNI
jgi:hypothetical protein